MKKLEKELYEMPEIEVVSVAIENGFAGSPNNPETDFDHEYGETEWEDEDDY